MTRKFGERDGQRYGARDEKVVWCKGWEGMWRERERERERGR